MFAIIKSGGKQYQVKKGDVLRLEKIDKKEGSTVIFSDVLLVADNKKIEIGKPHLKTRKVTATVLKQGKGDKIHVIRFKSKIRYRRKIGHRQRFTEVKILAIE